jgi:hypothetical protein
MPQSLPGSRSNSTARSCSPALRLLQLRFPFVKYGTLNWAGRQAGTTINADAVVNPGVLCALLVLFAFRPVNTLDRTDRHAITNSLANIRNNRV